jgi:DNA polymerase-1
MRARAKTINFATIYGQGALALSRQLSITLEEAKAFIKHYFERFSGVRAWLDKTVEEARQRGFVETLFGRRRYIPELRDRNFSIRSFGERTATNSPLQGSAADLIKIAMIRIHAALERDRLKTRMLLQVHDELVFEVPESERAVAEALVKREMEGVASLAVPLVVSVGAGKNWIDAKG